MDKFILIFLKKSMPSENYSKLLNFILKIRLYLIFLYIYLTKVLLRNSENIRMLLETKPAFLIKLY
ncbi:MAG TPA: hypothetical protein DCQ31_07445 [Bacteroidales bacterium]|nr:hypothetical protein [Bacteroidales bacterium]